MGFQTPVVAAAAEGRNMAFSYQIVLLIGRPPSKAGHQAMVADWSVVFTVTFVGPCGVVTENAVKSNILFRYKDSGYTTPKQTQNHICTKSIFM